MTDQHPITPPPELVKQWKSDFHGRPATPGKASLHIASRAAQWGADQELEACIAWMKKMGYWGEDGQAISLLRAARRPKSASSKERALARLEFLEKLAQACGHDPDDTILRALEALPDD